MFVQKDNTSADSWKLVMAYQANNDASYAVEPGDPISIVVGDVYLPRDFRGTKHVVVIVDIVASESRGWQSYAVWYQDDARAGQRLGFDSILAYSDRAWSPLNPPRFWVRVMDVTKEKNEETRTVFASLNSAVSAVGTFIPHPAVPAAATALKVAGLVAANRQNTAIIDFTPQFYGADFVDRSGPSDLPLFQRGTWLAIGRPEGATESFWENNLRMDRRSGRVFAGPSNSPIAVPYMRVTVATAEAIVPSIVLENSKALFDLLSSGKTDGSVIQAVTSELESSLKTYNLHKNLVNNRSRSALGNIVGEFTTTNITITPTDQQFLLTVFNRTVGQNFSDFEKAEAWWRTNFSKGDINKRTGKWEPTMTGQTNQPPAVSAAGGLGKTTTVKRR